VRRGDDIWPRRPVRPLHFWDRQHCKVSITCDGSALCRDLAAYSYLTREATFSYAAPEGAAVADPATAGAAAAAAADASDGAAQQAGTRASARAASLVPAQTARAGSGAGSQPSPQHQQGEAAEQPAPGSYSAALLRAFQPGAAEAAHVAARQLKAELMRRNADVARRAIEGAAAARVT
jgi:hypothetical protein